MKTERFLLSWLSCWVVVVMSFFVLAFVCNECCVAEAKDQQSEGRVENIYNQ